MPVFLDTNILLYGVTVAPAEFQKRAIADAIMARKDCVLSFQTLQEFYTQAVRKSRPGAMTPEQAREALQSFRRFRIIDGAVSLIARALTIEDATNFSYWDCAIIAAAIAGGCDVLYTEDLRHGREVEGVRIVNPFLEAG
ncbi:MAG: PIN domain-containing protein [Parvularculaceae bacterium]|nr:PIN domain-containing protein [Parvularculaceae bacterium]